MTPPPAGSSPSAAAAPGPRRFRLTSEYACRALRDVARRLPAQTFEALVDCGKKRVLSSSLSDSPLAASFAPLPDRDIMKTYCVTGASGYIASHIVRLLLESGDAVRGTVRDAGDAAKTAHLRALPGAAERLALFSAELEADGAYDEALAGCDGLFHVASPLPAGKGAADPEALVLRPAIEGTRNVLASAARARASHIVVTSSMSAMAPAPEPPVKDESHWSDADGQKARESFYGASKTLAERAAYAFVAERMPGARLCTICPTMVVGPMLQPTVNLTMASLARWFRDGKGDACPDDSMSFVHVADCAAQHVAAMRNEALAGRFMSLDRSLHWNDLVPLLRKIHPAMPDSAPRADPCRATQFDTTRQATLGVPVRPLEEALADAHADLAAKGLL